MMDQATFEGLLGNVRTALTAPPGLNDLTIVAGRFDAPVVVLIHGIGGTAQHWTDPVSMPVDETWLFDLAAPPPSTASGLAWSPPYQEGSVTSWARTLGEQGMTAVTWSQRRPNDLLEYATVEASALLSALEAHLFAPYEQDAGAAGLPPLVLLCHSRGGLVARAAMKALGAVGLPHLRVVVTLCTPHAGSYMPRLADDYDNSLRASVDFHGLTAALPAFLAVRIEPLLTEVADQVRAGLLHRFGALIMGPGYDELLPGSATLTALAVGEEPLPGVRYYSFGGSNPAFVRFYLGEAGQRLVLPEVSPLLVAELSRLPEVAARYGGLAELSQGDSAVALARSSWPASFGVGNYHQVIFLNHMQALVAPALQTAVLALLRG